MLTIYSAITKYLDNILLSRSKNTARTYKNALTSFCITINKNDLDCQKASIENLKVDAIIWFSKELKSLSPATERLYLTAVAGFYEFLAADNLTDVNLPRLRMLIRQRSRRTGQRLPQFPRKNIEIILTYANNIVSHIYKDPKEKLRNLRDCAFLYTLADTGLRVHEACNLRRGDIDWNEGKAIIIGKGDQQDIVRFSNRSMHHIRKYLQGRSKLDGMSGKPLSSLPLFSRHDKGAGSKILPITTTTGRNIVSQRVAEALGEDAVGTITPHTFRHYFVTTVLLSSGGNLKLAQELARHRNITVTQRYAHLSDDELDKGYWEIFDQ